MILIGLTGGIGSGKSTVARMLEAKGAKIIDADLLGHAILEPGGAAYEQVVERFGGKVVARDTSINRAELGRLVFADPKAREDLNAITHPEIYKRIAERLDELGDEDSVVVLDAALLVETLPDRGRSIGLDALIVVAANAQDQIDRLAQDRGMSAQDAEARLGAQAPAGAKLAAADYVLDNRGSIEDLSASVDLLWDDLTDRFGKKSQE